MTALADRTCRPLPTGTPALSADDTARLLEELGNGWSVFENRLRKSYTFSNFATALAFVNKLGAIADEQDHHPDVSIHWGDLTLTLWTHAAGGVTRRDLRLARALEDLARSL